MQAIELIVCSGADTHSPPCRMSRGCHVTIECCLVTVVIVAFALIPISLRCVPITLCILATHDMLDFRRTKTGAKIGEAWGEISQSGVHVSTTVLDMMPKQMLVVLHCTCNIVLKKLRV